MLTDEGTNSFALVTQRTFTFRDPPSRDAFCDFLEGMSPIYWREMLLTISGKSAVSIGWPIEEEEEGRRWESMVTNQIIGLLHDGFIDGVKDSYPQIEPGRGRPAYIDSVVL